MADEKKPRKGMRTFASDLERARKAGDAKKPAIPKPKKDSAQKPEPKKSVPAIPKPDTPKKAIPAIPGLEDLQKSVDAAVQQEIKETAPKAAGKSEKKTATGNTPVKAVGGGTIITDTKESSFSLFPEMGKSMSGWFSGLKKRKKKKRQLGIPETSRRKGVIQQATTKTGTIFTADSETLKERIKARQRAEGKKPHEPETIWTPNTDAGYDLLPGETEVEEEKRPSKPTNVQVAFKKRAVPVATKEEAPEAKVVEAKKEEVKEIKQPKEAVTEPKPVTTPVVPKEVEKPVVKEEPVEVEVPEPEVVAEEIAVAPETVQPEVVAPAAAPEIIEEELRLPEEVEDDGSLSTNMLTLYIFGILLGVGILGFLGYLIFTAYNTDSSITVDPAVAQIENASLHTLAVDSTFSATTIKNAASEATLGKHEFVLENPDGVALPPTLVFELVTPDVLATTRQYVTDVRFVTVDRSNPITYITFTNRPAMQGELLSIEQTLPLMFADLYDSAPDATFVDQRIANTDVRVLTDELGRSYLTYGFTDDETLIITGTLEDFATLVRN